MAKIHPCGSNPQITSPVSAQIREGETRLIVTESLKKPCHQRLWVRMPMTIPTRKARPNPIAIRVRVAAKLEKNRPLAINSGMVSAMRTGPGSRFSPMILDNISQAARKNT